MMINSPIHIIRVFSNAFLGSIVVILRVPMKFELTRKDHYVADGHLIDPLMSMTYSSDVSRNSVRIGLLIAALNDIVILAGNIQNAYLNATTKEKIYFIAGNERKGNKDRVFVIICALYGLKNSALQFCNHISDVVGNKLGFTCVINYYYLYRLQ